MVDGLEMRNKHALENQISYLESLELLVEDEFVRRQSNSYQNRLREATPSVEMAAKIAEEDKSHIMYSLDGLIQHAKTRLAYKSQSLGSADPRLCENLY